MFVYEPITVVERIDRRSISGRRPGYPPFGITPYYAFRETTKNHLLIRSNGSNAKIQWKRFYWYKRNPQNNCVIYTDHYESVGPQWLEWQVQTHLPTGTNYIINSLSSTKVSNAIASMKDDLAVEALTSYDILTDVAEAREIPRLVRSISESVLSALRALYGRFLISDLRDASTVPIIELLKHPRRIMRTLGKKWMEYRYGIMPLVYSYRDIMKTLERGNSVSRRLCRVISPDPTGVSLPGSSSTYTWTETVGDVTVRGTVFQYYSAASAARISGLGVNPLRTAWELIPYSFVVDWFVNVGDYITRSTSTDLSTFTQACISTRSRYTVRTWQHYPNQDVTLTATKLSGTYNPADVPNSYQLISRPEESQLLKEVETDSYDRFPFSLNAAQLTINPNLNWRRLIDSAVMANNQLRSFSRTFR